MMPVVNTCVNEVNHRLTISRLPGRLRRISCGRCNWLVWKVGSPASRSKESQPVKWTVGEAGGCVILDRAHPTSSHAAWPLGRVAGDVRTVLFFTQCWKKMQKVQIIRKGFYVFLQEPS